MSSPGSRALKLRRPVKASVVTGVGNLDFLAMINETCFPDSMKTLGGSGAMRHGGGDLYLALDSAGAVRCPLHVIRCELNADPSLSKIEVWYRIPFPGDTTDTDEYWFFGDATAEQPAASEPYGQYDVYNGTTDDSSSSVPFAMWAWWTLDELPTDPYPQYKDATGHGRHATLNNTGTRIDLAGGRGVSKNSGSIITAVGSKFGPGTGEFCFIQASSGVSPYARIGVMNSTGTAGVSFGCENPTQTRTITVNGIVTATEVASTGCYVLAASRSGDVASLQFDTQNYAVSGLASVNFTGDIDAALSYDAAASALAYTGIMSSAPNSYWLRAHADNINSPSTFHDCSFAVEPAQITAEIYFDGLHEGSEVRIYEEPHPQIWTVDTDSLVAAELNNEHITFAVQGESSSSSHYIWFNYNSTGTDPAPGGTGHAVALDVGDTDEDIASAAQTVLNGITDLSATVSGTIVTVTNERNGEIDEPADFGTDAAITLLQVGGTSTAAIDGIEDSVGSSWTATYSILRPRRAVIHIMSIPYKFKRYSTVLTISGLLVPAGAMQIWDSVYANQP